MKYNVLLQNWNLIHIPNIIYFLYARHDHESILNVNALLNITGWSTVHPSKGVEEIGSSVTQTTSQYGARNAN